MNVKPARTLRPGDVLELQDGLAEVIDDPFLGQSGASPFDARKLFWRARVRPLGAQTTPGYATWDVDAVVRIR